MKKFIASLLVTFSLLGGISAVFAAPNIGTESGGLTEKVGKNSGFSTNVTQYTLSETIGRLIKSVLTFVGTIFFVLVVYAGFLWMTAQGNDEKVAKAKNILQTATIGMIIVVMAYSITVFVMAYTASSASA